MGACEPEAKPEAKADPWLGYYGYAAHPYAYSGLYHHAYAGYPYATHGLYYGKRSADAEPTAAAEPAADADAYYGYYGYGARPYYGYYGLGYRGYHGLGYRGYLWG